MVTISNGRSIGKVKNIYLTTDLQSVAVIHLGTDGLFSRRLKIYAYSHIL